MANITAQDVKALRDRTDCGMMDCKRALQQANGDQEEAIKILREMGLSKAAKKGGRIAAEGVIFTKVEGNKGVIGEINCETDFCAKSDKFLAFVDNIVNTIFKSDANDVDALMECTVEGVGEKVSDYVTNSIATIGENIKIRRFQRMEGTLIQYIHDGGRLGTLVKLATDKPEDAEVLACGKNVALQITALNAQYVCKNCVPESVIANEKEVQTKLVEQEGKPANVAEKIVEGRMRKFYEEVCLLDQAYFKDDKMNVGKYIESVAKAQGCEIKIDSFIRYERGEGIEKKQDDFAAEVAKMAGN